MPSSGKYHRIDLVQTDVSEECIASATCSRWFLARGFFYPEDGGDVPPKRRFTQDVHGDTSQKTAFFIVIVVKTSNLTQNKKCSAICPVWETLPVVTLPPAQLSGSHDNARPTTTTK
jgi:hypothetical protein